MRRVRNASAALLLGALCAVLVACGDGDRSGLVPSEQASALNDDLAAVRSAVQERDCPGASDAVRRARSTLDDLGTQVDRDLRSRIRSGLDRLADAAATECEQPETTDTTTVETTTTPTTPTTTTTTIPTTTTTVPTTTTPPATTTVPPTTTTTPPPNTGGVTPDDDGAVAPDGTGGTGGTP